MEAFRRAVFEATTFHTEHWKESQVSSQSPLHPSLICRKGRLVKCLVQICNFANEHVPSGFGGLQSKWLTPGNASVSLALGKVHNARRSCAHLKFVHEQQPLSSNWSYSSCTKVDRCFALGCILVVDFTSKYSFSLIVLSVPVCLFAQLPYQPCRKFTTSKLARVRLWLNCRL